MTNKFKNYLSSSTSLRTTGPIMTTTRKFLRLPAVIEATGWSRATIWRKVKAGVLPAPIPIGPKSIAWDAEEIAQWQQRCIDASPGADWTSFFRSACHFTKFRFGLQ
ncbi:AlpA family transcriptional regulator [Massilia sp. Root418]|uniref:helix-turn-helix transcriptional regulator n=1 Tax=Massilia sp. Root418 TaxID=1736532 RepID=UPI0027D80DC0|nr:AlpA family transcriptional regulator [Massilia sp. Root418]